MTESLDAAAREQIFTEARSYHAWKPLPVGLDKLHELYELFKWGPTSGNAGPARFVFVTTDKAKAKLYPVLQANNVPQVRAAPVTVIVAYDDHFHNHVAKLFPAYDTTAAYAANDELRRLTALRNGSLQGAYAMLAARALGLDICGMSGFYNDALDEVFFAGTTWRSNFIFTLGYGDASAVFPRGPRLSFEEACVVL